MKLKIECSVGECWESFDMEGDYEEVSALVTELGFCNNAANSYQTNVIDNPVVYKEQIISEFVKTKCYGCHHE